MEHVCEVCNYIPQQPTNSPPPPRYRTHHHSDAIERGTLAQPRRYSCQERKCPACGDTGHRVRNCQEFLQMKVKNRLDVVDLHGLCKLCLNQHGLLRCWSRFRCEARHNALLHLPSATHCAELLAHNGTTKADVLFRIVPVVVEHGPIHA